MRGPRTDPCGTPADISQYAEELFLITTFCRLITMLIILKVVYLNI
jgi:hypothetical protein